MSVNSLVKSAPTKRDRPLSAAEQIDKIASTFSLSAEPNHVHGDDVRSQLLSSYIEWLAMEQRAAASELWPGYPHETWTVVPANTRWGNWHFGRARFPGANWTEFQHPLTRAAFVLWAVGAIDDIPDAFSDQLAGYTEASTRDLAEGDDAVERHIVEVLNPLRDRFLSAELSPTTMTGAAAGLRFVLDDVEAGGQLTRMQAAAIQGVIRFLEREVPNGHAAAPDHLSQRSADHTVWNIERWREQREKLASLEGDGTVVDDDPRLVEASDREWRRWEILLRHVPTSIEGLKAKLDLLEDPNLTGRIENSNCFDVLLGSTIRSLAYMLERSSPGLPSQDDVADPVFDMIERHKALVAASEAIDSGDGDNVAWIAAIDEAWRALEAIASFSPPTLAGCAAMAAYVAARPCPHGDYEIGSDALDTLASALKAPVP